LPWRLLRAGLVSCVAVGAALSLGPSVTAAAPQPVTSNVPYALPVTLPPTKSSPSVDAFAPYTPQVLNLIRQLEPDNPPTQAELANADALLHGGTNPTCHNVGPVAAPTGTDPSIAAPCWSDAQGINVTSGPNGPGGGGPNGQTLSTSPTEILGLASTFDRRLANVWGQTEGIEGRQLMVTGLFGPQTDLDRLPNWGRGHQTAGEDPYLSNQMVSAQINGVQGVGLMSEMKHFAVYNGQNQNANTDIQDQALHELYLTPYEGGFVDGRAAATMCSYQLFHDTSTNLPGPDSTLSAASMLSPFASPGQDPITWPLDESHFACEQPLTLTQTLRDTWGSQALVGSDYPATHSTSGIMQGEDQEMPTTNGFLSANATLSSGQQSDPTGSTCADASGNWEPCSTPGAVAVGGMPNGFENFGGSGWSTPSSTVMSRSRSSTSRSRACSTRSSGSACWAVTNRRPRRLARTPAGSTATGPGRHASRSGRRPGPRRPRTSAPRTVTQPSRS
jgi:beta-glucosidase